MIRELRLALAAFLLTFVVDLIPDGHPAAAKVGPLARALAE